MEITSAGIDIGTTTTQLVISRLTVSDEAPSLGVPRVRITDREVICRSGIHFTPFRDGNRLDDDGIRRIVEGEYMRSGFCPRDIATGAVIITGDAARKHNADAVLAAISEFAGRFVVSTAGPDLESILAGRGSGASRYSSEQGVLTVNIDIGGGTTNIALYRDGHAVSCCCLDIGGRQVRVRDGLITCVSPSALRILDSMDMVIRPGDRAGERALRRLTDRMAELLYSQVFGGAADTLLEEVRTANSSALENVIPDAVFFSGGVADCIFSPPEGDFPYGDIGKLLGQSVRRSAFFETGAVRQPAETLRATVIGAGVHLLSVSGSTVCCSPGVLPLRNVPVLRLSESQYGELLSGDTDNLSRRLAWLRAQTDSSLIAVSFAGRRVFPYREIELLSDTLARVYRQQEFAGSAVILAVEEDMAKALGQALRSRLGAGRAVVSIDGVSALGGDYLDLGEPVMNGTAVPVAVKTLITG